MGTATRAGTRHLGVETTGIGIIQEDASTARPAGLFWPWCAANASASGVLRHGAVRRHGEGAYAGRVCERA